MTGCCERTILVPSSLTMETRDLRARTLKVGLIARAAAVFRYDRVVIYRNPEEHDDSRFMREVLRYMDTPQYLRRLLIPRKEELRHVGILPPLRTVHHPLNSKSSALKVGEFRVGAVVESVGSDNGVWVEIGVDRPVPLVADKTKKYRPGQRLNVRIFSLDPLAAEPVDKKDIPLYWGYETEVVGSLEDYLRAAKAYVVLTSRKGSDLTTDLLQEVGRLGKGDLAVVFGSPARGVDVFLSKESMERHCMINTIPHQGTETVRTEEAVFATLALLNLVRLEE